MSTGPERRRKANAFLPTTQQSTESEDMEGMHQIPLNDTAAGAETGSSDWSVGRGNRRHIGSRDDSIESNNGLHHRHVRRTPSGDQADEYERGMASVRSNVHSSFQSRFNAQRRRKRYPYARWLRTCVLAGIPAYLVLIFLFLKRMNNGHTINKRSLDYSDEETVTAIHKLHEEVEVKMRSRPLFDEQEWNEATAARQQLSERARQRRKRTTPPPIDMDLVIPAPTILSADELERPDSLYVDDNNEEPRQSLLKNSKLEEICGFQAQNAALGNPAVFTYRDSLIMPKTRVTRVLITGVLSQPAYMLALALKARCNVQVVIGFDAMYPNAIRNRLRLQEQMAVLSKFIPKLVRPIFIAFAGIDPLKHAKNFRGVEHTGEIDVLQTFNPTHIVHLASYDPALYRYSDPYWKNGQSPYVRTKNGDDDSGGGGGGGDDDDGTQPYDPALYAIRMGMLSMEQLLSAIAAAPPNDRPHFIYASAASTSSKVAGQHHSHDKTIHRWARKIDEVMADAYYQKYGVYSVGLRLPDSIYGPWGHPEQDLYKVFDLAAAEASFTNSTTVLEAAAQDLDASSDDVDELDLLHVDDVVNGLISAMQYRPPTGKPVLFELSSGTALRLQQVQDAVKTVLDRSSNGVSIDPEHVEDARFDATQERVKHALGWTPQVPIESGLVRTVAWHLDRLHPYGPPLRVTSSSTESLPEIETGDMLLKRCMLPTVAPDNILSHGGRPFLPCASECSNRDQCVPTMFDELLPMVQELTEECDIVLYTQDFDKNAEDFVLQSEFMDEGDPLVCNFAFVAKESYLVETVISKVPDSELGKLGFEVTAEDANRPGGIKEAKFEKLNGRLLYRGWILIWSMNTPEELASHEEFFLKLSPGRLFHEDVKAAVFIDQGFGVSPKADDIKFLVHEMQRRPWKARVVKRKTRPKAKFLLPAEPQRRAVVLMSELKFQASRKDERLSPDEKISTYEATRFMRFSNGEEPLGKEPPKIRLQREFYERLRSSINPDTSRAPVEPLHKFEMHHWARSRWVAHDMAHEESRQLRCEWYQEHVLWQTELDQLSFAFVMERLELDRKLAHNEPDEVVQKHLSEKTEMKKLLSDTFEWHALKTEPNKLYSPYEEMQILPYDMDYTDERALIHPAREVERDEDIPLYARVISDRIMSYARKAWNNMKPTAEMYEEKSEL